MNTASTNTCSNPTDRPLPALSVSVCRQQVDYAFVISGPVTVNSRLHGLKEIEDAWLEAVVDYGMLTEKEPENATEEEAHKAYVLDPYTYKFSFIKSKEY